MMIRVFNLARCPKNGKNYSKDFEDEGYDWPLLVQCSADEIREIGKELKMKVGKV